MKIKQVKTNLKKLLAGTLGIVLFASSSIITEAETSDQVVLSVARPGAGYVNTQEDPLIVRTAPSTSADIITSLPKESMVMIVERCGNGFDRVQYDAYGHYGYAASRYIREYDLEYYGTADTSTGLNVRAGTGTSYAIKGSIPSQANFPILLEIVDWNYVLYGTLDGYVATQYIQKHHY